MNIRLSETWGERVFIEWKFSKEVFNISFFVIGNFGMNSERAVCVCVCARVVFLGAHCGAYDAVFVIRIMLYIWCVIFYFFLLGCNQVLLWLLRMGIYFFKGCDLHWLKAFNCLFAKQRNSSTTLIRLVLWVGGGNEFFFFFLRLFHQFLYLVVY